MSGRQPQSGRVQRRLPLPPATARLIEQTLGRVENPGLLLDRYVPWNPDWSLGGEEKRVVFDAVADRASNTALDRLARAYRDRWQQTLGLLTDGRSFEASPEWRLVVGLGGTSVLETTMTLHRIYGLPIIPGSAIKGMTRAYAELVADADQAMITRIFGPPPESREEQLKAGEVIFVDAVPEPPVTLVVDVMNPHYGEWYMQKHPAPADYLSPVPVPFLTVDRATRFRFGVAARRTGQTALVEQAEAWIRQALSDIGVGAKTAAGYGFFVP